MMDEKQAVANQLFAAWLAENMPTVFNQLASAAAQNTGRKAPPPMVLNGFTDVLKSIGSGISSAAKSVASGLSTTVKSVGSFLGSEGGQSALTAAGSLYAATQLSKVGQSALDVQAQRAAAGLAPAPIDMTYDPATGTFTPTANGYALSQSQVRSQLPSYLPYILLGGGVLVAVLLLSRR